MKTIKAIETEYKNIRYRSRNEARWGIFLDELGIEFQYEPEGYEIIQNKKTIKYLPDFFIPKQKYFNKELYLEIKPDDKNIIISEYDEAKVEAFSNYFMITILGSTKKYQDDLCGTDTTGNYPQLGPKGGCDYDYLFCQCVECGCYGFEFNGRSERINCCAYNKKHHKKYNSCPPTIWWALENSINHRFWK